MQRDIETLIDIANAARLIMEFTADLTKSIFISDRKTQSSVMHQITIIGEAARRLDTSFRVKNSSIPWPLIIGMRSKLIHEYNNVDLDEVWKTAKSDIPLLLSQIENLIRNSKRTD